MTLQVDDFVPFYEELYGFSPFRWQLRMLESIVATGRWPAAIDAPTGAGKSSVVDIHVFANALYADGSGMRVPRRLATVVNRRALVDSQLDRAEWVSQQLDNVEDGILKEVASALRLMSPSGSALRTVSLRGGQPTDRTWVDDPTTTMVIAATPEMWGSRLLFRGYGTSRLARPRDAGMLAIDSVVVIDEAHLSRQMTRTAEDVAHIASRTAGALAPVPALNVVTSTATHASAGSGRIISVEEADFASDRLLDLRMRTPKTLSLREAPMSGRGALSLTRYSEYLAQQSLELSLAVVGQSKPTVLVVVNRRATAAALADRLAQQVGEDHVACWAGRMRPMDVASMREVRPGLFTTSGHPETRFLVATQTAEVGVDLDCAALLTELAPGSALAQRFGRVNRLGDRAAATVRVVVPTGEIADAPPYMPTDLAAARDWLLCLGDGADVSPWRLHRSPPPGESPKRLAYSDLWEGDAELLSRTTIDMFEEPELTFWLREELEDEQAPVSLVLRKLPDADEAAIALLRQTPVHAEEVFPATLTEARRVIERALGQKSSETEKPGSRGPRAFRIGNDKAVELISGPNLLRPGDIAVVDHDQRIARYNVLVPDPPLSGPLQSLWKDPGIHVVWPTDEVDGVDLCSELAGVSADDAQDRYEFLIGDGRQVRVAPELSDGVDPLPWVVLLSREVVEDDDDVRQTWGRTSASRSPVALETHQFAVAERADLIGRLTNVPAPVVAALKDAGMHHDDGKLDPPFQAMLRDSSDGSVPDHLALAKSGSRSSQRSRRSSSIRPGWRHEQLSAAYTFAEFGSGEHGVLVTRLAGTSHGHGRPFFPHGSLGLVDTNSVHPPTVHAAAVELYRTGAGWSEVLDRTEAQFGVWGVAFLEAMLRAADAAASREGS